MQIDNVIKQLQYDGHYELADFLLSTIEGLKGEVERLTSENKAYHEGVVAIHESEKAALREEVLKYREVLEEIIEESAWGDEGNSLHKIVTIARKALGES